MGERYSHAGAQYRIADSPALPKPVQQPHPPIIIGGGGTKRTPQLAARFANEFNRAFDGLDATRSQFERVRDACAVAGRDPASLVLSAAQVLCVGENEAEIERRAARIGRDAAELRANGLAGTVDEVVAKIHASLTRVPRGCIYRSSISPTSITFASWPSASRPPFVDCRRADLRAN